MPIVTPYQNKKLTFKDFVDDFLVNIVAVSNILLNFASNYVDSLFIYKNHRSPVLKKENN